MDVYEFIYKTYDICDLLEIYKNINDIKIFNEEDTLSLNNFIVEKIIYKIYKYNLVLNNNSLIMMNENDKFRILFFNELITKLNNFVDPFDIILMNIHNSENFYRDNNFLIKTYYKKFQNIVKSYTCFELIELFEKINHMKSIVLNYYLYLIYDEIVDFVFSLSAEYINHFYTYYLNVDNSAFKKLGLYYENIYWVAYYLIYIYECDEIYQFCLLYRDLCKEKNIINLFSKNVRTNLKTIIIKKIICLIYRKSHEDILKLKKKYMNYRENYFILLLKNYDRVVYHILMLSYFYNTKIPNLLKLKTLENLENSEILYIPHHDIKNMIFIIKNIIINDIQENCINEQLMDY